MVLKERPPARKRYIRPRVITEHIGPQQLLTVSVCFNDNDCGNGFQCCIPGTASCQLQGSCE